MKAKNKQMHRGLTKTDRKNLREQCKMGLILSLPGICSCNNYWSNDLRVIL